MAVQLHGGDADANQMQSGSVSPNAQYVQIRNQLLHNDQVNVFFQFVQDNSVQIAKNQQAVIHEAEERHRAILGQSLDSTHSHFESIMRVAADGYSKLERCYLQLKSASQTQELRETRTSSHWQRASRRRKVK